MSGKIISELAEAMTKIVPKGGTIKSEAVVPNLLKKGVKADEITYANLDLPEGRLSQLDLDVAEFTRKDNFETVEVDGGYQGYNTPRGASNPTYREKVLTFKTDQNIVEGSSRYTSEHFPDVPNYLAHTRIYDDTMEGRPTRVILELQSDLHQIGRQEGYAGSMPDIAITDEDKAIADKFINQTGSGATVEEHDQMLEIIEKYNPDFNYMIGDDPFDAAMAIARGEAPIGKLPPKSPLQKTWLRKTMEREVVDAVNDGKGRIAIPISGPMTSELHRGEGVQTWYETTVASTAKKLARQVGGSYRLVQESNQESEVIVELQRLMSIRNADGTIPPDAKKKIEIYMYQNGLLSNRGYGLDAPALEQAAELVNKPVPVDTYAVIDLPGAYSASSLDDETISALRADLKTDVPFDYTKLANKYGISEDEVSELRGAMAHDELADIYGAKLGGSSGDSNKFVERVGQVTRDTFQAKPVQFTLYSSPVATAWGVYEAYKAGHSQEDIFARFTEEGYDDSDIAEVMEYVNKIGTARKAGFTDEQIQERLNLLDPEPAVAESKPPQLIYADDVRNDLRTAKQVAGATMRFRPGQEDVYGQFGRDIAQKYGMPVDQFVELAEQDPTKLANAAGWRDGSPKDQAYKAVISEDNNMTIQQLVASMEVIKPTMTSTITGIQSFYGSQEAQQKYYQALVASRTKIVTLAKEEYGVDLKWVPYQEDMLGGTMIGGNWTYLTPEGEELPVDPSIWQSLASSAGELAGGIAGGIAGAKAGATFTPPVLPLVGPLAKPIGGALGSIGGAVGGAALGSTVDYFIHANMLHQDLEAEAMAHKAMTAAEMAAIGDTIGFAAVKTLGVGWKGLVSAKNLAMRGNTAGAYKALKESTNFTDEQIDEVILNFERLNPGSLDGLNREQKAIKSVALSERGMQDLVRASNGIDPAASRAVVNQIDGRAQELMKTSADMVDKESARVFVQDLQNYEADVREFYTNVKSRVAQSPRIQTFEWDFEEVAIQPILDDVYDRITDPTVADKFLRQAQVLNNMSESKTLTDLIEFRHIVNDFLFNKRITKADDKGMLRQVLNKVDEQIEAGARQVIDSPEQWLDDWHKARSMYSKMKQVQSTAMYRAVFDGKGGVKAVKPETVIKGFAKHIDALDGSFETMMGQLPVRARGKYEAATLDYLVNRFTAGTKDSLRAVNFPMLADELNKINFTTKDARAMKKTVLEMAEVFKNDVYLSQASGLIKPQQFQSYLTADPIVRAKFEIASGVFNTMKTWVPGSDQRNQALIKQTAKLLEKPLDGTASRALKEAYAADPELMAAMKLLQDSAANKMAQDGNISAPVVKIYEGGKFKGTNQVDSIPAHRIATVEQMKVIADQQALTIDSPMLNTILKQYGYRAVMQGSDRVRILGDK